MIAVIIVLAVWNLALKVLLSTLSSTLDPTDYAVFQTLFGMIFTVIIALEFKRSLLVLAERVDSVVQVRAVLLIALLAVVPKLIILDFKSTDAMQLLALNHFSRSCRVRSPPAWTRPPRAPCLTAQKAGNIDGGQGASVQLGRTNPVPTKLSDATA